MTLGSRAGYFSGELHPHLPVTENQSEPQSFESALTELESLVLRLESSELSLEESLRLFERGVELTRQCQGALRDAEQRVEQLIVGADGERIEPFEPGEPGS